MAQRVEKAADIKPTQSCWPPTRVRPRGCLPGHVECQGSGSVSGTRFLERWGVFYGGRFPWKIFPWRTGSAAHQMQVQHLWPENHPNWSQVQKMFEPWHHTASGKFYTMKPYLMDRLTLKRRKGLTHVWTHRDGGSTHRACRGLRQMGSSSWMEKWAYCLLLKPRPKLQPITTWKQKLSFLQESHWGNKLLFKAGCMPRSRCPQRMNSVTSLEFPCLIRPCQGFSFINFF